MRCYIVNTGRFMERSASRQIRLESLRRLWKKGELREVHGLRTSRIMYDRSGRLRTSNISSNNAEYVAQFKECMQNRVDAVEGLCREEGW